MAVDRRKILKNSIWLFVRMGINVIVSLFTARIVLDALGASDYGLYNVVGGIVLMLSFLTGSLSQGVQRFINTFLAKDNSNGVNQVLSASFIIVILLGFVLLIVGETVGLWFLNSKINIPPGREVVANWIYQFALVSLFLSLVKVPLQGLITAYEDFSVYAKLSLVDVFVKLGVALSLYYTNSDRLFFYSVCIFLSQWILPVLMFVFCKRNYKEFYYSICKDKSLYKELYTFSGWNLLGTSSSLFSVQGINIILNLFFGTVVNAARAVAYQVSTVLDELINNIQYAANPQIQKLYSQNDKDAMFSLMEDNFRWNFMLYWIIALPIIMEMDLVLSLWLVNVPQYTVVFAQIAVARCLLKCFERPLNTCLFAVGRMKWVNIVASFLLYSELIIAYVAFSAGMPPYWCFLIDLIVVFLVVVSNSFFCSKYAGFCIMRFIKNITMPVIIVILLSVITTLLIKNKLGGGIVSFLAVVSFSVMVNIALFCFLIASSRDKAYIQSKIRGIKR